MKKTDFSVKIKNLDLEFGPIKVLQNLNLDVEEGEFIVLLGSSGCGKSTLLNCIAGLLEPTRGQIFIKDRNVTWLEPSQRGIGMVFQSYALYPQMTVKKNMSFGLKNARVKKEEIERRVASAAAILQLESLLDRKPGALSGGQRQRVAIGRALVRDVDVFLFDEPLSNLDAKLRADLRVEIKRLHHQLKNTMIYVTHDQIEAMTLADRIAVMRGGNIMQLSSPEEIYNLPRNKYVAGFIGSPAMNFIKGKLDGTNFTAGKLKVSLAGYKFSQKAEKAKASRGVVLGLRPEHIETGKVAQSAPVKLKGKVTLVEPMGSDTLIYIDVQGHALRMRVDGHVKVALRSTIDLGIFPSRASVFDQGSEDRL